MIEGDGCLAGIAGSRLCGKFSVTGYGGSEHGTKLPPINNMLRKTDIELPVSKYRCMKCGYEFTLKRPTQIECLVCGNLYVKWVNVDEVLPYTRGKDGKAI